MTQRGDIVLVHIPFVIGMGAKTRPALVIQCDRNNRRLLTTLVAAISSKTRLAATEPTQLLVDPTTPEGQSSGLLHASAVKCENLFTIAQAGIQRTIGHLSPALMLQLDDRLRAALELP